MTPKRQRLYLVIALLASFAGAVGIALYALQDNVSFFYTPEQVQDFRAAGAPQVAVGHVFRLGGLVKTGSLQKRDADLTIRFIVADKNEEMTVEYKGILPDLFREGQGVVATGTLRADGVFDATQLLAKHDEKYMPPEVAKALKEQHDR